MTNRKSVLLLTHNYPRWRGDFAGVFIQELVAQFSADQIQVTVLAPHFAGAPRFEETSGVIVHRFRYLPQKWETLAYTGQMHKLLKSPIGIVKFFLFLAAFSLKAILLSIRLRPTCLFAQWLAPAGLVGWLVSTVTRRNLFVTSHGTDVVLLKGSKARQWIGRLVYRRAKRVFTVSSFLRETLLDFDMTAPDRIEVLPMPVRSAVFGAARSIEKSPPLVLCVARFTAQKQLPLLIQALRQVRDAGVAFACEIYGEGELEQETLSLIAGHALSETVTLHKPLPQAELAQVYASARVTVLPSINEGFGMTLVEAQLSGSAVIGARSGGITDIIDDQRTGLLFEPGNAAQLALQIKSLLVDNELHHRLVTAARKSAQERFSATAIARRYVAALGIQP